MCQQQHRRWARDQKKVQETIKQLERAVQEAEDGKERAHQARRAIQLQLKSSDSELLETISLLKKTQHALELERLHHYSLRSQIASMFSVSSQDRFQHQSAVSSLDPGYILTNEAHSKNCCRTVPAMKDVGTAEYFEPDQKEHSRHNQEISRKLSSNDKIPHVYQTKCKLRDPSPVYRPSSTRINQVGTALTCHQELITSSDNNSKSNVLYTRKHKGMFDTNQSNLPCQLDDLAAVDGLGKEHFPFHQGRTEVDSSSESSSSISAIIGEQISGKQIGSKTGMSHQDESTKSSCHQNILGSEASKVLIQIMQRPSAEEVGLTAKRTASADFQETSQGRTNYYVLEAHSTRSNNLDLEIPVNHKTVQHSSLSENPIQERVHMNIDIIETNSQKTVQGGRCGDNPSDQQRVSSSTQLDHRKACQEVSEVYTLKLSRRTSSGGSDCDTPASCENDVFSLDSADRQKYKLAHRRDLQCTKRTELETKRLHGDEALYKLSCRGNQDEVRQCGLDNQHHIPVQRNAIDDGIGEEEVPTHIELGNPLSNQVHSAEQVSKESCASEPSKPVYPTESLLCDLRQWLTNKICMDLGYFDQAKPSEHGENQQLSQAKSQVSEAPPGNEELREPASRQSLESEELQRLTEKQQGGNISISRHVIGQQAQCKQSESSSTGRISGFETIGSPKKTDILGNISSEESFNNPTKRTSSVKNTPEVSNSIEMALEATPYCTDSQQDQGQNGDEDSGGGSRVQSEQGSYSPGEGTIEWIDDFPTAVNSNYLDNSDAFSVPDSDIYPSGDQSSK